MGKPFNLGKKLKYPITITKLLKQPGDSFRKQDAVFQYTFTWNKEVGDPFGETWQEKQTTIADWESPAEGTLLRWKIHEGMVIERDTACADIEEACEHAVQYAGLCAICGKDMKETSWAADGTDSDRATVKMIHDQTLLAVSQDEASRAENQLQRRLLKLRKLSLVVDLDQTIIHACIEPTVGEWQRDPNSPNYEAVKDVKAFQLNDDGPRGLASGIWYYIKMRPGLKSFLSSIAELYELHVYTMGTRAYAQNIAKIVDADHKLFGDRIISRDENGSMTAKTLSRLFPVDTKMVVIIDDRADVWPKNRLNLIKVVPYDFFVGIGDINSSFLPKRQDLAKEPFPFKKNEDSEPSKAVEATTEDVSADTAASSDAGMAEPLAVSAPKEEVHKVSALEELVSMAGGDDEMIRRIQAEEQVEFLEKQLIERPLLHMQQELDKEDSDSSAQIINGDGNESTKNGDAQGTHQRHNLLKDDDVELSYLEGHLKAVHKAFYEEYDRALAGAQGGRVAHLRPGGTKKVSLKADSADLKIMPDIGEVMPRLKAQTLAGCVLVLSGVVPLGLDVLRSEIVQQAVSFGAQVQTHISRKVTHLVVRASRTRTQKARQAAKYSHIKVVNLQWLTDSMSKWNREDESSFLVNNPKDIKAGGGSSSPQSIQASEDESIGDDLSDDDDDDEDAAQSTQEDGDPDGVAPEELEDPTSPIDDLKSFDWGSADAELEEFMASGSSDSESDTESVASQISNLSHNSTTPSPTAKRKHAATVTDDEADQESSLLKKQRIARSRTTGLKTVKTPNSPSTESSLPTPEITGGEDEVDLIDTRGKEAADAEAGGDDDFEAEMLAELEKGDWGEEEEEGGGDGEGGG